MTKRKAFVHIGLDDGSGDFLDDALGRHAYALAELGVRRPATTSDELFRAALEILREHRAWGFARSEVEGAWSRICRRARKGQDTIVVSQPLFATATTEQVDLLVDSLAGFEVHVVVTAQRPDAWTAPGEPAQDLGIVLDRWAGAVRRPERLHVLVAGDDRTATWRAFGSIVGFGTASLAVADVARQAGVRAPHAASASRSAVLHTLARGWVDLLTHTEHDVVGNLDDLLPPATEPAPDDAELLARADHELNAALHEVERLRRRNQSLELRLAEQPPRKLLKRRLSAVA